MRRLVLPLGVSSILLIGLMIALAIAFAGRADAATLY